LDYRPGLYNSDPQNGCRLLLTEKIDPEHPEIPPKEYYTGAAGHVNNLRPFDGSRTTWTVFAAQIFQASTPAAVEAARKDWDHVLVCALFLDGYTTAASQGIVYPNTSPATDIYITSTVSPTKVAVDQLRPATVLHEALHGFAGKGDRLLTTLLMDNMTFTEVPLPDRSTYRDAAEKGVSDHITRFLEQRACAPR